MSEQEENILRVAPRLPLAVDKVRYAGDPVAVVLAESRYLGEDARDLMGVEYTPLLAVTDVEEAASAQAPLLYEEFGTKRCRRIRQVRRSPPRSSTPSSMPWCRYRHRYAHDA